jgi:hypothetical protein
MKDRTDMFVFGSNICTGFLAWNSANAIGQCPRPIVNIFYRSPECYCNMYAFASPTGFLKIIKFYVLALAKA